MFPVSENQVKELEDELSGGWGLIVLLLKLLCSSYFSEPEFLHSKGDLMNLKWFQFMKLKMSLFFVFDLF